MYQAFTQMTQKTFQDVTKQCEKNIRSFQKLAGDAVSLKLKTINEICSRPNPYAKVTDMPSLMEAQLNWISSTGDIMVKHANDMLALIKGAGEQPVTKTKEKASRG